MCGCAQNEPINCRSKVWQADQLWVRDDLRGNTHVLREFDLCPMAAAAPQFAVDILAGGQPKQLTVRSACRCVMQCRSRIFRVPQRAEKQSL